MKTTLFAAVILLASSAFAEPDYSSFYEVTTDATAFKLKAGDKAKLVIEIKAKGGAHVSDEAPLKIELAAKDVKVVKENLTYADSVNKKVDGGAEYPNPRFEVPFTAGVKAGTIDAKMTFFVCTANECVRQKKSLTFAVAVNE